MSLVLLPGLACDATVWRDQLPALAAHAPVVTDVHARFDSLPEMAAALLAEHAGPLRLAGTSMGGMVALEVLRQAPQRVRGLALLGSTARADTPSMQQLRREAIVAFEQGRVDEVLRANLMFAFHPRVRAGSAIAARYLAMIRRAGAAQLIRQNRAVLARADQRHWLPGVACPVLVACGEDDRLTPPELAHELAAAIPGSRLALLPDCGHMLTLEQPQRVNALLLEWLESLESQQAPG